MAKGMKTEPALEEQLFASYLVIQSYRKVGRKFGVPSHTVFDIVRRLAGDELSSLRAAYRSDMVATAMAQAEMLLPLIKPGNLGTEHSSKGAEAAKALDALVRAIDVLGRPVDENGDSPATELHVHLDMQPPPELAGQIDENTTTTLLPVKLS